MPESTGYTLALSFAAHAVERRGVGWGGGVGVETVGAHDLKIVILERRHF